MSDSLALDASAPLQVGLNQYTAAGSASFTYDANGNLTSDGTRTYVYDVENRLVSASGGGSSITLRYDPLGRLYETSGSTSGLIRYLHDGNAMIAEYNSAGTMLARHVHGSNADADDPLVSYTGTSTALSNARFLYADPRGSIVLGVDWQGLSPSINTYDEYGIPGADNTGRFQYTGQVWLPDLGMYYYKARMYSPTLGRFMQTDPIGYADGMNWYNYVGSDPVNAVDPTGLACVSYRAGGVIIDMLVYSCPGSLAQSEILVVGAKQRSDPFLTDSPVERMTSGACDDYCQGTYIMQMTMNQWAAEANMDADQGYAPQKEETSPCDSTLYRIGEALSYTGDGTTSSGLAIAAIGAPAGGVGAAPGLFVTGVGGGIGAVGQAAQDIAFDRPALEIGGRFLANVFGGKIVTAVVPRSVRNDLGDAIAETVGSEFASLNASLSPDRCP